MAMDDQVAVSLRRHYGNVYRFVRRRTSSREDAEDITQEVFTAAIAALGEARIDAETPPLAWLYTVARRRLIDRLRAPSLPNASVDAEALVNAEVLVGDTGERLYGPAIVGALLDALRSLDEAQRQVVVLKVFEGRSFAEIAAKVGASEDACRMRFSRGLAHLRRQLTRKGVTP
jgi:RNA polymerase sigma factor (sigma-70 family)